MTTFSIGPTVYRPDLSPSTDGLTPYATDADFAREELERVRAALKARRRLAAEYEASRVVANLVDRSRKIERKKAEVADRFAPTVSSVRLNKGRWARRPETWTWVVSGGGLADETFTTPAAAEAEARRRARSRA